MTELDKLLKLVQFTHLFQQIRRVILVKDEDRNENDAEHSFQLAFIGWSIATDEQLDLDQSLIVKYALVHDLVEVYAGDTYFYSTDEALVSGKARREHLAAERIKAEFPELEELHRLIAEYNRKANRESRFVYALDKLLPMLNIFLDNGRSWHRDGVTLGMILENKPAKIALDATVKRYFDELVALLKRDEDRLFPPVD